jgi:hypothetical protein
MSSPITNKVPPISEGLYAHAVAYNDLKSLGGTAGVNVIKRIGYYHQTCTFKRFGRQDRCIKLPHSP